MTYHRLFHKAWLEPLFDPVQVQIDANQTELPSPLNQLVWLNNESLQEENKPL